MARPPPTFLFHTADDPAVPAAACADYFTALHAAGVEAELHIFAHARHGIGFAADNSALAAWPGLLDAWLRARGVYRPATP